MEEALCGYCAVLEQCCFCWYLFHSLMPPALLEHIAQCLLLVEMLYHGEEAILVTREVTTLYYSKVKQLLTFLQRILIPCRGANHHNPAIA